MKSYTEKTILLKTAIAHAEKPEALFLALNELYEWQWALVLRTASYLPELSAYSDDTIKQSDPIDSYALLTFIKAKELAEIK